jgi:hypothetical protein
MPAALASNRASRSMAEIEYLGICPAGHRSYLRLRDINSAETDGVCTNCGQPALLIPLDPI